MGFISWKIIGESLLNFLQVAWKPLVLMAAGVFLAHMVYYGSKIDNLELKVELQKQQVERLTNVIKDQNQKIQDASETSKREFKNILEGLRDDLKNSQSESARAIRRILETAVPQTCTETNAYLLEQLENLKWENSNE